MNTIGLVAFAFVGSSMAIREEYDVFGIIIVGLAIAFAGGMTRDLLVTRVPLALQAPIEINLGLLGVGLAIALGVVFTAAGPNIWHVRWLDRVREALAR